MEPRLARADGKHAEEPPKPATVELLRGDSTQVLRQKLDTIVRDFAYRLYQNNGEAHGKDLDHWAEAQAKVMSSDAEIRESGPWFHCNCPAHGAPAPQIQVAIDPAQVVIYLNKEYAPNALPPDGASPIFYWAKWPQEVDPSTASAYVLDSTITIEVKKTDPPAANPVIKAVKHPAP